MKHAPKLTLTPRACHAPLLLFALRAGAASAAHEPPSPCSSKSLARTSSGRRRKKCCCSAGGTSKRALSLASPGAISAHAGEASGTWSRVAAGVSRAAIAAATQAGGAACGGHCSVAGHMVERVQRGMADCGPRRCVRGAARWVASLYHAMSSVRRCLGCAAVAQAVGTTPWSSSPGEG